MTLRKIFKEVFFISILVAFVFIITGCDKIIPGYEFKNGKEVAYCVIEERKDSRLVCVNQVLMKENPLFGVKNGESPYSLAVGENGIAKYCWCNPELTSINENKQQGKELEVSE